MSLFLVGSGPTDSLDDVHDEFVAQARRLGGRIAIAMLGDEDDAQQYLPMYVDPIRARWPEAEIVMVYLDDDGDTAWPDDFDKLSGFVVAGGWTPGYLDALTPRRDAISRLVRGGVPYLGFSAGAMIVSRHAIVGGWRHQGRSVAPEIVSEGIEEVTIRDGLALIGPTVETHTDAWSNLGVALAALESSDSRTAVTIDEGTTLVVDPTSGRTRVVGPGRVHWLQQEGVHVVITHEVAAQPAAPAPQEGAEGAAPREPGHPKPSRMPRHAPSSPSTPDAEPSPQPTDAQASDSPTSDAQVSGTQSTGNEATGNEAPLATADAGQPEGQPTPPAEPTGAGAAKATEAPASTPTDQQATPVVTGQQPQHGDTEDTRVLGDDLPSTTQE